MNEDRGMMKWLPYKSLNEQASILKQMRYQKGKREKPQISNEIAAEIDYILRFHLREKVRISYWDDGYPHEITGRISFLDTIYRCIHINGSSIPFSSLEKITLLEERAILEQWRYDFGQAY